MVFVLAALMSCSSPLLAKDITTNSVHMTGAPEWLLRPRVDRVTDRMQTLMEWSIRKVEVYWHTDQREFEKIQGLGSSVLAVARKSDNSIHIGPRVNDGNFDQVFGHELAHIISFQKYKGAIPKWLEEGLANHLAHQGRVDYRWLSSRPFPEDVKKLTHPFKGSEEDTRYHYMASQALAEMISSKCDLQVLLQLSVERKLENYLGSYCEIKDLNVAFKDWVQKKSKL
jgi:hypothetical protein